MSSDGDTRPRRDWLDVANFILLVLAFFAAAAAAYESYRLAGLTHDAIDHADTASTTQHLDTLTALAKAEDANKTSRQALADSEIEARIRLRAYLSIAATRSPLVVGRPLVGTVIVQSGGQTPAMDVKGYGHSGVKPLLLKTGDIIIDAPGKEANSISLNPGNTISQISTSAPIDQFNFDLLRNGQTYRFYLWGWVGYRDVFGCHRWQNYCFRVNDSNASNPADIDPCTKYNEAEGPPGECPTK